MTEMIQALRKLIQQTIWTEKDIETFHFCRVAVSDCQELYFLDHTASPI
jgi:hypothetical protein